MSRKLSLMVILSIGCCVASIYADENTPILVKQLAELGLQSIKATKHLEKAVELLNCSQKIAAYSRNTDGQTKNMQNWLGDAKSVTIKKFSALMKINQIQNGIKIGKNGVALGKELYGVYNAGKNIYKNGKNIYEAATAVQESIDKLMDNMEKVHDKRQEVIDNIRTIAQTVNGATSLNEIMKNKAAIKAETATLQAVNAQDNQMTNLLLMQKMNIEQSDKIREQSMYDAYVAEEKRRMNSWRQAEDKALDPHEQDVEHSATVGDEWDF